MINKLANTQQKLQVLKNSDKQDVIDFLERNGGESRGRKRSTSKFRRNNKLRNVHSINAEAQALRQPQMQFVDRSNTIDAWGKKPNASFLNASFDLSPRGSMRKRSRSKQKLGKNSAYVSMMSSHRADRSMSRSRSQSKPKKKRSSSVRSSKSSSKPKQFKSIRNRLLEQHQHQRTDNSADALNESSIMGAPAITTGSHATETKDAQKSNTVPSKQLPKTRIIKVKKKAATKKRSARNSSKL